MVFQALRVDSIGVQRYSEQFMRLAMRLRWDFRGDLVIFQYKNGLPGWLMEQLSTAEVAKKDRVTVKELARMVLQLKVVKKQQNQQAHANQQYKHIYIIT